MATVNNEDVLAGAHSINVLDFFNGTFIESFDALVTSDGATITMTLEKSGGGDLTMHFSDGQSRFDCTPAATIALTVGTDDVPKKNYIYILQSTKALTKSTTAWPTAEHIRVGLFYVQSAALVNTGAAGNNFVLINHNLNDHASDTSTNQGHGQHITERVRRGGASWESGAQGVATQDGNDLWVSVSAGVVFQMHRHVFAALDSDTAGAGDPIVVVNDPDAAFTIINSLNSITKNSDGDLIGNNKYVKFILFGVANKGGEVSPMMLNLPSEHYNTAHDARVDVEGYANFTIPTAFATDSSTGFLIAAFICKHTAAAMQIQETIDLRSTNPATAPGTGTGGGDVSALAVIADNAICAGDGGAKDIQGRLVFIDDAGNMTGIAAATASGLITAGSFVAGNIRINVVAGLIQAFVGDLDIRAAAGSMLVLGRVDGDIAIGVIGETGPLVILPAVAGNWSLGNATFPYADGFFTGGVRTMSVSTAVALSSPPTVAEVEGATIFNATAAALGDGFIGLVEDDTGGVPNGYMFAVINGQWFDITGGPAVALA